ncbi:unnamed protein product [Schistocephalus solidus]|uniref:GPI-anchored wall transfer protein n=1 Tax=Schistocephalus solidus TaxID=70667 RepID=A0A183SWA2_SCHSO|nr:unnamed protein product [Schistocephalus solidus]
MDSEKTARHLKFISNLTGGTIFELTCLAPLFRPLTWDFLLIITVFVLPITLLSEYIFEFTVIACTTAILLYRYARNRHLPPPLSEPLYVWRRALRAYILLYTCVCIYAVDFPLFPRRLAKTEAYGVSLMDVGVGLISVSCGISNVAFVYFSRSARPFASISSVLVSTVILIFLGVSRTILVKLLGYPEHITEYGLHWNFFATMAVLPCTVGHQAMLLSFGLERRLALDSSLLNEESRRTSLLLANAEGLVSLPGYFALYLWGMLLGFLVDVHLADGVSSVKYKLLAVQEEEQWFVLPLHLQLINILQKNWGR